MAVGVLALTGCASGGAISSPSSTPAAAGEGHTTYPLSLDNCDFEPEYKGSPTRAVSLNQSATEILIRLGVGDRIVGTGYEIDPIPKDIADDYHKIPLLSDAKATIQHEKLLEAQPDFVYSSFAGFLTADEAGERQELQNLGVGSYLTEFDCVFHESVANASFETLFQEYRDIAKIFDVPNAAEKIVAEQQATLDKGVEIAAGITGEPKVMWFYSTYEGTPYAAGPGGLPQTTSELLGAKNIFDDASTKWPEVSWDEVAARNPDVIILADLSRGEPGDTAQEKIKLLKSDPLTKELEAVKNERFIVVPGQYMDPSFHSVEAIPAVAQGLVDLS